MKPSPQIKKQDQEVLGAPAFQMTVLIIEPEPHFNTELSTFLGDLGYNIVTAKDEENALDILQEQAFEILLLDISLHEFNGLAFLRKTRDRFPSMEVIIVTQHRDKNARLKAITLGALDYIEKPLNPFNVQITLERTVKFISIQKKIKVVEENNTLLNNNLEELVRNPGRSCNNAAAL